MRYAWGNTVALAACYSPAAHPGAPCGPNGECPSGLTCIAHHCVAPGTGTDDAAIDADPDGMIDGSMVAVDAPIDAPPMLGPWGTPVVLSTGISSETDPSFTSDRLTVVFMSEATDDIYIGTRATTTATTLTATLLAEVNSTGVAKSPEISPDGLTLYFVSDRGGNFDVYRSTKSGGVWSAPALLADLSTAGEETDVAISPDGLTAVVVDNDTVNTAIIHTRASTAQPFGAGVAHPELTVGDDFGAPTITNGGNVIYFHAGATRDIYVATKQANGTYTTPVLVSELDTANRDAAPFVSQDNKHMMFERESDLYETSR
jgi:Tol biopolymer transport system component